jgi:hypothetical protein
LQITSWGLRGWGKAKLMKTVVIAETSDENMRGIFFPDISKSLLKHWEDYKKCAAFQTFPDFW